MHILDGSYQEAYHVIIDHQLPLVWQQLIHEAEWSFDMQVLINPFPNKPWFLRVCSKSLLKTLWEKE